MLYAVVPGEEGSGRLQMLGEDGIASGPARDSGDLAAAVAQLEAAHAPRWLWSSAAETYPPLIHAGVRVARCHDVELTEALLSGYHGQWGAPRSLPAAWARLTGAPVPPDPPPRAATAPGEVQGALFEPALAGPSAVAIMGVDPLQALAEVYVDQLKRIAATAEPGRFRLLVAAESAGALIAAEMSVDGLPWRADVHEQVLRELLGEPSPAGGPPRRLVELTEAIRAAFGDHRVHPDSPAEVLRAFSRAGIALPNTRAWVLQGVDHPAAPLLREYKELYRIFTAHGWSWRNQWVRGGRFYPEFVPAGVVSGRWATRGGGALQIPKAIRRAVIADDGWRLVVADAGQLEPRILAAVSGDASMVAAAAAGDMYAALAQASFAGDRAAAKLGLLAAMYGSTSAQSAPALATLRLSYPTAFALVEEAARTGEAGGLVRSWLGRTCPPPSAPAPVEEEEEPVDRGQARRARGRFTRNFVIQATAAEWALVLLASLRSRLSGSPARLVFFQHDEVIVHAPADQVDEVTEAVHAAGVEAGRLLFGDSPVRFPLGVCVVDSYADAK